MSNDLEVILEKLNKIDAKISSGLQDVKDELMEVNPKLKTIEEQTASNTEYRYEIKQIEAKVHDLETDVRLIKKAITNQ